MLNLREFFDAPHGQFDLVRWPGIDQKDVILSVLHRRLTANAAQR